MIPFLSTNIVRIIKSFDSTSSCWQRLLKKDFHSKVFYNIREITNFKNTTWKHFGYYGYHDLLLKHVFNASIEDDNK